LYFFSIYDLLYNLYEGTDDLVLSLLSQIKNADNFILDIYINMSVHVERTFLNLFTIEQNDNNTNQYQPRDKVMNP